MGKDDTGTSEQFSKRYNADQIFYSKILKQEIKYTVLLPSEYLKETTARYGVVYLLHGWGGDQNSWGTSSLNIQAIADEQESKGNIRPLIYVIPQGFNTYFCNRYDGSYNYMDMFVKELIPFIDKRFRTIADREERAVAGFSMGGFGALSLASLHPELFSVSVGLSPSLNTDEQYINLSQDGWDLQWGSVFGGEGMKGGSRLTNYYKSQCPLHFFHDKNPSDFQSVHYYIDCGDDEERLYVGNGKLHSLMLEQGIAHEYRVRNGAHTESYWYEGMKEALPFIEQCFQKKSYPQETLQNFAEDLHSQSRILQIRNTDIELWTPDDYDATLSYRVLYYSKGEGNANLTTRQIAQALDSLMQIKRLVIVGFDARKMLQANISFTELTGTVESTINAESSPQSRLALVYGKDADYLYNCTTSYEPQVSYFFVEDAEISSPSTQNFAKLYYLDMTDQGSHHQNMLALFSQLRASESPVQYRVRNGMDTSRSAQTGIYSMSSFLGSLLLKK